MNEPDAIKKGMDVELEIESLAFGGMGVARLNDMVTFVKNAIPGQRVTARITKKRTSYLEARSLEVLHESP
ncbi:MAG: TRAM domain-containing protein, partial [Candidatus Marinimicrobia bacterium]|nr:TRAM domain-containing protein [Candidatus Neomarinimicrobiota bacterium]